MRKKILTFVLSLFLCIGVMPQKIYSEQEDHNDVVSDNVITTINLLDFMPSDLTSIAGTSIGTFYDNLFNSEKSGDHNYLISTPDDNHWCVDITGEARNCENSENFLDNHIYQIYFNLEPKQDYSFYHSVYYNISFGPSVIPSTFLRDSCPYFKSDSNSVAIIYEVDLRGNESGDSENSDVIEEGNIITTANIKDYLPSDLSEVAGTTIQDLSDNLLLLNESTDHMYSVDSIECGIRHENDGEICSSTYTFVDGEYYYLFFYAYSR